MNRVVVRLTVSSLLGRRRVWIMLGLPLILLSLAVLIRLLAGPDDTESHVALVAAFGLGTLMPLLGLIAGTGAIGPEIEDSSIIYVLAKPIRRSSIMAAKLLVAVGTVTAFGVLPIFIAGVILTGEVLPLASSFAVAALAAAVAYSMLFLMLATVTRNAVVIGLIYALVWESVVGQFVPGARALSVQQWALAIGERVAGSDASRLDIFSAVELRTAIIALIAITVVSFALATSRLKHVRIGHE